MKHLAFLLFLLTTSALAQSPERFILTSPPSLTPISSTVLVGLSSMAYQSAGSVAITGGSASLSALTVSGTPNLTGTPALNIGGARYLSTYGTQSMSFGNGAGSTNTGQSNNTNIGYGAGQQTSTGSGNVNLGTFTGYAMVTTTNNTALGQGAAGNGTFNTNNTIVGQGAANKAGVTWGYSTLIGQGAGTNVSGTSYGNVIFLGYDAGNGVGNLSNAAVFGNSGTPLLVKNYGDIQVDNSAKGFVLKSPDGTCYRVTVANGGTLSTTSITCP